jgi:hypothetical protein
VARVLSAALAAARSAVRSVRSAAGVLGTLSEIQKKQGYRLNAIDGRLALIEKHTGMVKA